MARPAPAPLLLHRTFEDFDELAVAARHWDLDLRQLDRGRFEGELLQVAIGKTMFSDARFGRTLDQRGSAPPGMRTIAIPANSTVRFNWRRKVITGNDILVFPRSGELESISHSDFHVFIISLPESRLQEILEMADAPELIALLQAEKVTCRPEQLESLRQKLRRLATIARQDASLLAAPGVQRQLESEIPQLFLDALRRSTSRKQLLPRRPREVTIRRAEDYIRQNIDEPLTVREICHALKVSERTLQYAFREYFGITPKSYLKAIRLNAVRRELKFANSSDIRINAVANRWGFWHMSQFAIDYRKQFGELPSQTKSLSQN